MATKKFCDYCGKEIPGATLDGKWLEVMIGKPLKVSVTVYDQAIGDTDLCNICYCDAVEAALARLQEVREMRQREQSR